MRFKLVTFTGCCLLASSVFANDRQVLGQWYVQAGAAHVSLDESFSISAGGALIPGASATATNSNTPGLGVGYFFNENWSAFIAGGVPPETKASGTGPLAGLTLGKIEYAPVMAFANYHFNRGSQLQPFVGAGFVYNHIIDTSDDALTELDANNKAGPGIRAGFDYMINESWGVFGSVNTFFLEHTLTGNAPALGGAPVTAKAELNPTIVHVGVTYRF